MHPFLSPFSLFTLTVLFHRVSNLVNINAFSVFIVKSVLLATSFTYLLSFSDLLSLCDVVVSSVHSVPSSSPFHPRFILLSFPFNHFPPFPYYNSCAFSFLFSFISVLLILHSLHILSLLSLIPPYLPLPFHSPFPLTFLSFYTLLSLPSLPFPPLHDPFPRPPLCPFVLPPAPCVLYLGRRAGVGLLLRDLGGK